MAGGGAPGAFGGPPAMPPAPMAQRKSSSPMKTMMGGLGGMFRNRSASDEMQGLGEEAAPIVDDAPYRARAHAIADALDAAHAASDGRALELAVARLAELIEDVRSIGGLDALAAALGKVLDALRDASAKGQLAAHAASAAADLRAVAGAPSDPGTSGRDRPFWKFWK
jgi:hypothetical protein